MGEETVEMAKGIGWWCDGVMVDCSGGAAVKVDEEHGAIYQWDGS
jgi:hypothetical protein